MIFNGSNYAKASTKGFPTGNTPYSVSLWYNVASAQNPGSGGEGIFTLTGPNCSHTDFDLFPPQPISGQLNGGVTYCQPGVGGVYGFGAANTGYWKQITAVYNTVNLSLYVNGSNMVTYAASIPLDTSLSAYIGFRPVGVYHYNGSVTSIRVWNRTLNATEVLQNWNGSRVSSGLVAEWLGNVVGTVVTDTSGLGNDANITGPVLTGTGCKPPPTPQPTPANYVPTVISGVNVISTGILGFLFVILCTFL